MTTVPSWISLSQQKPTEADLPILLWNSQVFKIKHTATPDALRCQMGLTCFTHWMLAPQPPQGIPAVTPAVTIATPIIRMVKPQAEAVARQVIAQVNAGQFCSIDDLEVLDALLCLLKDTTIIKFRCGERELSYDTVYRLRSRRGGVVFGVDRTRLRAV